jgi:hypothetical protein
LSKRINALGGSHSAVVDLSGGKKLIAIGGEHAADVLAKGKPLVEFTGRGNTLILELVSIMEARLWAQLQKGF